MLTAHPTKALTIFCALVGLVSGFGIAQFRIPGYQSLGALMGALLISIATFAWLRADSSHRGFTRSRVFDVAFVGLTFLVLPYYLVRSRGLKAGVGAIGVAVLIYLLYLAAMLFGVLIVRALRI
jgi:hypothetical protein